MTQLIDPRAELSRVEVRLGELRETAARGLWEVGQLLAEVERSGWFLAAGFPSFTAWLDSAPVGISRRQARRAIAIASALSQDVAGRFGPAKLDALVRWIEATPTDERPEDVLAARIAVHGPDGRFTAVSLADATARQLDAAARRLTAAHATRDAARDADVGAWRQRIDAALGVGHRVRVTRSTDGQVKLKLPSARLEDLEAWIAAARAALPEPSGR